MKKTLKQDVKRLCIGSICIFAYATVVILASVAELLINILSTMLVILLLPAAVRAFVLMSGTRTVNVCDAIDIFLETCVSTVRGWQKKLVNQLFDFWKAHNQP